MPTLGRCSNCNGRVTTPDAWYGVRPPTPTCERCKAVAAPTGPVVPMEPPQRAANPETGELS